MGVTTWNNRTHLTSATLHSEQEKAVFGQNRTQSETHVYTEHNVRNELANATV